MGDIAYVFDTDYTMKEYKVNVTGGKVIVKDGDEKYEFFVDKVRPVILKGKFSNKLVYFFKWNVLSGMNWRVDEKDGDYVELGENGYKLKKELVPFTLKFGEQGDITPEFIAMISDMKFLKNMKTYAEKTKERGLSVAGSKGLFLIIIFVVVFVITFLASYGYSVGWF